MTTPWGLINTTHCASIWLCVIKQIEGGGGERGGKTGQDGGGGGGGGGGPLLRVSFIDG